MEFKQYEELDRRMNDQTLNELIEAKKREVEKLRLELAQMWFYKTEWNYFTNTFFT